MAILNDNNQNVYTDLATINSMIAPNFCLQVNFSDDLIKLASKKTDAIDKSELYSKLPELVIEKAKTCELIPTILAKIEMPLSEHLKARLDISRTPHINHGNEMHVFLQGSGVFGFKLNDAWWTFSVSAGDVLFIEGNTPHWFKLNEDNQLMIASYHQDEFEVFHQRVEYL